MDHSGQQQREREWWLLLGVVLAYSIYTTYQLALVIGVPELHATRERLQQVQLELQDTTRRLGQNKSSRLVAEQEAEVVRGANRLLREEDVRQQAELAQLRSDLDFYRRLTRTGGAQSGLAIYTTDITPTQSPLVYRFEITLTHNIRRAAIVSGQVLIDLEGTLDDRPVTLYWSQLTDGNKPHPSFRFKYFQEIEGYLALPENFRPTQIVITLEAENQPRPIRANFDWLELIEGSQPHQQEYRPNDAN